VNILQSEWIYLIYHYKYKNYLNNYNYKLKWFKVLEGKRTNGEIEWGRVSIIYDSEEGDNN